MKLNAIGIPVLILLTCALQNARAQETLDAILDRGFPAQWYVCGPFDSDLPDGIPSAIANDQRALGRNDYMASVGGMQNFRPRTGLQVTKPNGSATWILSRQESSNVDLSPFFPEQDSGVAFSAFTATNPNPQNVLIELHSVLGARVFLNGEELREIAAGPFGVIGVDQFVAPFQSGSNLLVLEVPGANFKALEATFGLDPAQLMLNRTNLNVQTGFEFDLRMQAVEEFGDIFFAPRLQDTNTFSGVGGAVAQDAWLTLFNPTDAASPEIRFSGRSAGSAQPINADIAPIPPKSISRIRLAIPVSRMTPGQIVTVQARLASGANTRQWPARLTAETSPEHADIYVAHIPGTPDVPHPSLTDHTELDLDTIRRAIKNAQSNPGYGFNLGAMSNWWTALTDDPELRAALTRMRDLQNFSAQAAVVNLDYRLANGESLIRNWGMGETYAAQWLETVNRSLWAWNAPYIPSQTAQLLSDARSDGLVHNIDANALPELYNQLSPDGTVALQRRKTPTPQLRSILDLHKTSLAQHRLWNDRFIHSDLVVYENQTNAPEPFWSDTALPLAEAVPAIIPTGEAPDRYFTALRQERNFINQPPPLTSRPIRDQTNLHVLRNPELLHALARLQSELQSTELFTTIASAQGIPYPNVTLESLWLNTLHLASVNRLTTPMPDARLIDYLAILRESRDSAQRVAQRSLEFLATDINTTNDFVPEETAGALVVFNPSNWIRSDIVETVIQMDGTSGLSIVDFEGRPVDFEVINFHVENNRLMSAHIRFLATNVPGLGHKAWYIQPDGGLPQSTKVFTPFIENEFYRIEFQDGLISKIEPNFGTLPPLEDLRFNQITAYPVEQRGDTLAWNGESSTPDGGATGITMENTPLGQRAILETPFLNGTLKRTVTLQRGISTIDIQVELTDVSRDDHVFAAEFAPISDNTTPILGEPFGSIAGIRDPKPAVLSDDTPQLPAPNFAQRFHTAGAEAGLDVRATGFVPLESALIIHAGDARAAEVLPILQRALIHHGIPSAEFAYSELDDRPVWQDDTLPAQFHEDFGVGTSFVILIGNADNNPFTENFIAQLNDSARAAAVQHIDAGRAVYGLNKDVPFGIPPMPTLLLAADTTANTASLIENVSTELKQTGTIILEADQALTAALPQQPEWGLAILHNTPAATNLNDDTLTHYLYTPGTPESEALRNAPLRFEYKLKPYVGRLRNSDITRLSHANTQPMLAAQTTIHDGTREAYDSYITIDTPNVVITGLSPLLPMDTSFAEGPATPELIALRAYEHTGFPAQSTLQAAFASYGKAELTPLGATIGNVNTVSGNMALNFDPFNIKTLGLYLPPASSRARRNQPAPIAKQTTPIPARAWQSNHTPATPKDRALVVRIQDTLPAIDGKVQVTVTNNSLNEYFLGDLTAVVAIGWDVTPDSHPYSLGPGRSTTFEFTATRENVELEEWGILAQTEQNGRIIFDSRSTAEYPVEAFSERKGNEYLLIIRNRGGLPIIGDSKLISSFDLHTDHHRAPLTPEISVFTIAPYQDKRILHTRNTDTLPDWITAKITVNADLIYHDLALVETAPAN